MNKDIKAYNDKQTEEDRDICNILAEAISCNLPEAENIIWHAHPVWFLDGNPIVGFSKLKNCIRLLFWSGQSFEEDTLQKEGSFKAAEIRYTSAKQIDRDDLKRWIGKVPGNSMGLQKHHQTKGSFGAIKMKNNYYSMIVVIAIILAIPLSIYLGNKWLEFCTIGLL